MQADTHALVTFFLTGRCTGDVLQPAAGLGLRPALLAGYQDLGSLRYDYPLVLVTQGRGAAAVESLSGLFDRALQQAASGPDGERVRKQDLRVEREIRRLVAAGATGSLSALIDEATTHVAREPGFEDSRRRLRAALACDGELAGCDAALPRRLLRHLWRRSQEAKAKAFRERVQRLALKLGGLLEADVERSPRGVAPQRLAASMGPGFAEAFDFDTMSRLLARSAPRAGMPPARRQRIRGLLNILESQRFFPAQGVEPYAFEFDSCAAALKAWRERLPKLAALSRALAIAELEVRGEYDPERHDALFDAQDRPEPAALVAFPDLLVCMDVDKLDGAEHARLMEILASSLPIKVLLQTDDLTGDPGSEAPGMRSRQLASLAMCLNTAYVLQAGASHLLQYRERLQRGLAFGGPALFSVYSGAAPGGTALPPYLMAAAATEARVFPAFVYDPGAGVNWAERFTLEGNPQVESDWPVRPFGYEDAAHQSVSQELAFTAVDFLALDPRFAGDLARTPADAWNGRLVAVPEGFGPDGQGLLDRIPSLSMVDGHNRLHKVVVARSLLRQAGRCRDLWHSLQELAGIHNSHAEKALAQAQREWSERAREEGAAPAAAAAATQSGEAAPVAAPAAAAPVAEEPQRSPDEPYIETSRCSSCNECIQLNPRMFAYDANQQAYIADLGAGTYAQLVEAAENCQVAVIHPGKPRSADEPGLADLLKRAEAFA
jgi:ferredoxin